jgi:hypothetical protein
MENFTEVSKKKTKRNRRSLTKTKRNFKRKNHIHNQNASSDNIDNSRKEEVEEDNGILTNWFSSWF